MHFLVSSFIISLIGLAIATYTDFRDRNVYNWLTYSLIAIGLLLHLIQSLMLNNAIPFLTSALVTSATFFFCCMLWKAGVFAGGDVKLFTAIASLNPFNPNILNSLGIANIPAFSSIALPVFPLTLFIFSVFSAAPYGAAMGIAALKKNRKIRKELALDFKKKLQQTASFSALIVGLNSIFVFMNISSLAIIPALIVVGIIGRKTRLAVTAIAFAFSLAQGIESSVFSLIALIALFMAIYSLVKFYLTSKQLLRKEVKITGLTEGTIVSESIYLQAGKVRRFKAIEMKTIINYFKTNRLSELMQQLKPEGRQIVSRRAARGVAKEEILKLQNLVKQGKLEDRIETTRSLPFVPAILIAYLALNVVGDLIWNITFLV